MDDLEVWAPATTEFQFYLQFTLHEPGVLGEDVFGVTVRSVAQLRADLSAGTPIACSRSIVVEDYDWTAIQGCVQSSIEALATRTCEWSGLLYDASLIFDWEGSGQLRQLLVDHDPGIIG